MNNSSTLQPVSTEQPMSGFVPTQVLARLRWIGIFLKKPFARFVQFNYNFGFRDQRYGIPDPSEIGQYHLDTELALNRLRQQTFLH